MKNLKEKNIPSDLVKTIIEIANSAGKILLKYHKKELKVDYKRDEFDPVTIADRESDQFLRNKIHELFPNDLILSEENSYTPESFLGRVWMIDPLDGTKDFVNGGDCYSIIIGLLEDKEPVFGCVAIPARRQLFFAEKGKGAYEKTQESFIKLKVTNIDKISESRLITRSKYGEERPLEDKIKLIPFKSMAPEGSVGTRICLIAAGKAEANINSNLHVNKWDTLGAEVILEEAGGKITDFYGNRLDYIQEENMWSNSFLASNRVLHEELLKKIKEFYPLK